MEPNTLADFSIFQRVAGAEARGVNPKLPIHIFTTVFQDWCDGDITQQEMVSILDLQGGQVSEVLWLRGAYNAAPNKGEFIRKLKNQFYCAEWPATAHVYKDEARFYGKLRSEIARQGGTPPELS